MGREGGRCRSLKGRKVREGRQVMQPCFSRRIKVVRILWCARAEERAREASAGEVVLGERRFSTRRCACSASSQKSFLSIAGFVRFAAPAREAKLLLGVDERGRLGRAVPISRRAARLRDD